MKTLVVIDACVRKSDSRTLRIARPIIDTLSKRYRLIRYDIPQMDIVPLNPVVLREPDCAGGLVLYSNAELTAVDLVQFAGHVGGFQRAATVLSADRLSEILTQDEPSCRQSRQGRRLRERLPGGHPGEDSRSGARQRFLPPRRPHGL